MISGIAADGPSKWPLWQVLDPEFDEVGPIIDFCNFWDNDVPCEDYKIWLDSPGLIDKINEARAKKAREGWLKYEEERERKAKVARQKWLARRQTKEVDEPATIWYQHELQEIPIPALAGYHGYSEGAVERAINGYWASLGNVDREAVKAELRQPKL
jgi:hypothetical protein